MNFRDGVNQLRADLKADIQKRILDFYKEHGIMPEGIDIAFVERTHMASQNREWQLGKVDVSFKL